MTQYPARFENADGSARLSGLLDFTAAANQPIGPGNSGVAIVTDAAAAPTTFVTPFVFDHTATTGGLYAWDGSAYIKVSLATT